MKAIPKERTSQCYREINGKRIYKTKLNTDKEAIAEAKRLNSKPNQIHKVLAYKCAICGKYHVGKSLKTLEETDAINKFIYTLVKNTKDIDQDIAKVVDEHFWDLI